MHLATVMTRNPFAVFAVAPMGGGLYAATTRAKDRGEEGRIGLPGGKVDPGEEPVDALIREAREEGFELIGINPVPVMTRIVDGKPIQWFTCRSAHMLGEYKEKGRIAPFLATRDQILSSGYGNEYLKI